MIGTDFTGSGKTNYHTIKTTTAPNLNVKQVYYRIKGNATILYFYNIDEIGRKSNLSLWSKTTNGSKRDS